MKVIGLTGGIGSGKSTVSRFLGELGATIIDADKIGHEVYKPDTEAWHEIVAAFGQEILDTHGDINRKKLGEVVFGDPDSLSLLNSITHPRIYDMAKTRIEEFRRQGVAVVVVEAALLIEADWLPLVDEVWVTAASETKVVKRVKDQRGLHEEQILARIHSQLTTEERVKYADMIINNDAEFNEVKAVVRKLWEKLHA